MSDDSGPLSIVLDSSAETFTEAVSVSIFRDGEYIGRMEILESDPSSREIGGGIRLTGPIVNRLPWVGCRIIAVTKRLGGMG